MMMTDWAYWSCTASKIDAVNGNILEIWISRASFSRTHNRIRHAIKGPVMVRVEACDCATGGIWVGLDDWDGS